MSSLPKTHGTMPRDFDQYGLNQLGIIVGQQGFDNNILMAEGFMKILPQILIAQNKGMLDNIYFHRKNDVKIDEMMATRLMSIWDEGLVVMIYRDKLHPETIIDREVIYELPEQDVKMEINGRIEPLKDMWECQKNCIRCGKIKYVQLSAYELGRKQVEIKGVSICSGCKEQVIVEIEEKPSFKEMELVRAKDTSPVWREIQTEVWVRYALEGLSLSTLTSPEAGFYDEFKEGRFPMFETYDDILYSEDETSFVSKKYYQSTMNITFKQFLFYYNYTLIDSYDVLNFRSKQFFGDEVDDNEVSAIAPGLVLS